MLRTPGISLTPQGMYSYTLQATGSEELAQRARLEAIEARRQQEFYAGRG